MQNANYKDIKNGNDNKLIPPKKNVIRKQMTQSQKRDAIEKNGWWKVTSPFQGSFQAPVVVRARLQIGEERQARDSVP